MRCTTEDIKKITQGAIRIFEEDGYTVFRRFTPYQENVLDERKFTPRQFANAGMRLEFYSPAGEISFDYVAFRGGAAKLFSLAVMFNGIEVYKQHCSFEEDIYGHFSIKVPESEELTKVTVYLPCLGGMRMKDLELPEGYIPCKREKKILMLGDSITQGAFSDRPWLTYVNIVADKLNAEVLNQGIGGDKFCPRGLDPELPFEPDVITVAYGTNDWAAAIPDLAGIIEEYFTKLESIYPNTPKYAIPPLWRGNTDGLVKNGLTLQNVRELVTESALRHGCKVIPSLPLVPPHEDFFHDKTLHPNSLGFLLYGNAVAEAIKKDLPFFNA